MARELSPLFSVLVILGFILVRILAVAGEPQVPCYFIFGDSLVDNGNNNGLRTTFKANYPPYGIDFQQGVTGRFTNGRTIADIIGQLLGFPNFIPPYATVTDQEISKGVNYGSGGAGIREETGSHLGDRISMDKQLLNHNATISRLSVLQNNKTFTDDHLKRCIYLSNIGSSDYINNYLMPKIYPTSNMYTIDQYATVLAKQYSQQLKTLYDMGARKVVVFGLNKITRSAPADISRFGSNKIIVSDVDIIDIEIVIQLENRLQIAIDRLNNDNSNARFTFISPTSISIPQGGLSLALPINVPCCPVRADGECVPNSIPFPNRDLSAFFDRFHPTDITNTILAKRAYNALSPMDASPYDISHLVQL